MLLTRWFQEILQSPKEEVDKFLSILLECGISGVSIKVLKCETEAKWVEGLAL